MCTITAIPYDKGSDLTYSTTNLHHRYMRNPDWCCTASRVVVKYMSYRRASGLDWTWSSTDLAKLCFQISFGMQKQEKRHAFLYPWPIVPPCSTFFKTRSIASRPDRTSASSSTKLPTRPTHLYPNPPPAAQRTTSQTHDTASGTNSSDAQG